MVSYSSFLFSRPDDYFPEAVNMNSFFLSMYKFNYGHPQKKAIFFFFNEIELRRRQFCARSKAADTVTSVWTRGAVTEWRGQVDVSPSSYSGSEVEISAPKAVTLNEVCTVVLSRLAQVRP